MTSPASDLERVLVAFRREHGLGYLRRIAGESSEARGARRAYEQLRSERGLELIDAARSSGELAPDVESATLAHVARAVLEQRYARARHATSTLLSREVSVEGDTRTLAALLAEWAGTRQPAQRDRSARAAAPALATFAHELLRERAESDAAVGELFARLGSVPRHPDAGPEGGAAPQAQSWLAASEELTREAIAFAQRALGSEGQGGLDHLWCALGLELRACFPRDGRLRRLASDWEPLGLRRLLSSRARAARDQPGPFPGAHVMVLAAPSDVRISASTHEYGLASELACAEAVGRAVGIVHGSSELPFALRFASVASVARALGALAVQRLADPLFLRRARGLSARESESIARLAATYALLDSRLAAASVLARKLTPASSLDEAAAFAERALLGPLDPAVAAALCLRSAPGAPFRAKSHAPALVWALRESFDEDWWANPRAGEPLRGAAARAGTFSVEGFATELGVETQHGIRKLSELF